MHHRLKVSTEMPSFCFVSLNASLYLITFWVYLKFLWSRLFGAWTGGMHTSSRDAEFTDLVEWLPWSLWACHTRQQTTIPDPLCTRENVESSFSKSLSDYSAQIQPSAHMWSTDVVGIVWKFSWHVFKTLCRVQSVLDGSARFDRRKTVQW